MNRRTLPRLRLRRSHVPHHGLILTDTPDPRCPNCGGDGGIAYDYGDPETGEYAGTEWDPCPCWNENRRWLLLRLPCRALPHSYTHEPPF